MTAITIRKSATDPLVVNHLCPLSTYSSPSRTADVVSNVGSEPAVLGSVIEKALRRSPFEQGLQPAATLLVVPGGLDTDRQELGVARIRRVVAEDHRGERGLTEDLVHEAQADLPEPHAPEVGRQVSRPEALLLDLLLKGPNDDADLVVREREGLEREDLLAHEVTHPLELLFEFGLGRKVPGHLVLLS